MSNRKRKRASDEEDGEMGLQEKKVNFEEGEGTVSSARSGRVRKKSAKVLEMEEAEELEKQFSKSSTKKQKNALVSTPITFFTDPQPNLDYPTVPEIDPLKLKLNLGALQSSSPNPQPNQTQDPQGGIKLKLMLSPTKDQGAAATSPTKISVVQNKSAKKKKANIQSPTLSTSPPIQMDIQNKNDKSKRKKVKKKDDEVEIKEETKSAPELLAALTNAPTSPPQMMMETVAEAPLVIDTPKPKKPSPKKKTPSKKKISESEEDVTTTPENLSSADSNPVYSDTQQMALKLKTSQERKASKGSKKKKSKLKQEESGPPKKKRAPTAYMLWCSSMRTKVVLQNPGIDFATISKRLGEIWHSLPEKEKLGWKRKAKKNAAKGSTLISTGKGNKAAQLAKPSALLAKAGGKVPAVQAKLATEDVAVTPYKAMATCPIDVAAHLKLLGESLSIIGARLQEHQGQIAVQGTLPVLLDSLLCALGPLMCLTNTLPETNGCPVEVHSKTLDNIAYIMPVG